jgi:hypothetical protein
VLANVLSNDLAMLRVGVRQDILNEVVAILIACNVNQGNARTIWTTLADTIKVATKEFNTTNLEALLDNLGSELVHAVLRSIADDVVNCPAPISGSAVFADVLNAPVAKLTVSNNIDALEDFFNAGTLSLS